MVCCFLGHRDAPDLLNELTMTIEELIINHSADIFFVGTHGNFDKQVTYIRHITVGAAQFAQYAKKHDKIMVEL